LKGKEKIVYITPDGGGENSNDPVNVMKNKVTSHKKEGKGVLVQSWEKDTNPPGDKGGGGEGRGRTTSAEERVGKQVKT